MEFLEQIRSVKRRYHNRSLTGVKD